MRIAGGAFECSAPRTFRRTVVNDWHDALKTPLLALRNHLRRGAERRGVVVETIEDVVRGAAHGAQGENDFFARQKLTRKDNLQSILSLQEHRR